MPILSPRCPYKGFPYEAVDNGALALLRGASETPETKRIGPRILLALECFLQVTGQRLSALHFSHPSFDRLHVCFVGALNSDEFNSFSPQNRYLFTLGWHRIVCALRQSLGLACVADIQLAAQFGVEAVTSAVGAFESLPRSELHTWLWRAWPARSRSGKENHLPLYPIYIRLGREFTELFHRACLTHITAKQDRAIPGLRQLCEFIGSHDETLTCQALQDPKYVSEFLRRFCIFYFTSRWAGGNGARLKQISNGWSIGFLNFFRAHLESPNLFAKPADSYPLPAVPRSGPDITHVQTSNDGKKVQLKLLTPVPLQVTDGEALQILFVNIERDLERVEKWAIEQIRDIDQRLEQRDHEASQGVPRLAAERSVPKSEAWDLNCLVQSYRADIAATFLARGFQTAKDANIKAIYPVGFGDIAHYLALPTTGALLAHCALLVLRHPVITTSFLETLELYDQNGQLTGLVQLDSGPTLVGYKRRKGPEKARQVVTLTEETKRTVDSIVAITQPIRDYLKRKQNDDWRYLLLRTGRSFGKPSRWNAISESTSIALRKEELVIQFAAASGLTSSDARELVNRFSLDSLRASAGVREYLRTRSVQAMSDILGHEKFVPKLLQRYLPEPIIRFFSERWIRIFQNAFIIEVMKDSPMLLHVTDFTSASDLTEFILNHSLRSEPVHEAPDSDLQADHKGSETTRVLFGVNCKLLTLLLLRLSKSTEDKCNRAPNEIYIDGIARHLIEYIETQIPDREDIQDELRLARIAVSNLKSTRGG